jgi:glutaredoxin 3
MKNSFIILIFFLFFSPFKIWSQSVVNNNVEISNKEKKTIVVYGSEDCHYCTDTKKFLIENKIDFIFFDIDKDKNALNEMLAKLRAAKISANGLGIPVIDKYGEVFTNNINFEDFLKKLK